MLNLLSKDKAKITIVVVLVVAITLSHYFTHQGRQYRHLFYQEAYFLPLILAGFWFGLTGAIVTSLSISALYLHFILMHWNGFSPEDFNRLLAIVVYNIVAITLGILREREWKQQKRFREGQERLRATESLAAMGRAMAGVAHDMKTPLIAIGGFSRLVQKHHGKDDPCYEKLDIVIRETQRLENMLRDMLDFSRPMELHCSTEDVSRLINETIEVIGEFPQEKKVVLEIRSPPDLILASLDAMNIKRALINLIMNAVQASPEGETVTICCYQREYKLFIEVMDRGCGIPADKREEVFLPFYTEKKEGTGLGLPIAKKIIEAHQGRIEIMNNHDRGLTFRIVIPSV